MSVTLHTKSPTNTRREPREEEFGELVAHSSGVRPDYSVAHPLQAISGYTNYTPQEMTVVSEWRKALTHIYQLNGFTGIELRPVEYAQNLLQKGGMSKQIYGVSRLQDGGLTKLGIPFDRTVPLAIFIAQHVQEITFPYFRSDIGYAFRGEHASKGRYRAFIQADIDVIDRKLNIKADAKVIATMIQALQAIGIHNCNVYVNHIAIAKGFMLYAGIAKEENDTALRILDKLKPDNRQEVINELCGSITGMTEAKANELLNLMSYEGGLTDFEFTVPVSPETIQALESLRRTENMVVGMGIAPGIIKFRPCLTRGLDYYTGIVCETFIPGKERLGSIASGGRYDGLVDGYTDKPSGLQGVGVSIGLTRLFDVMKAENNVDLTRQTSAQVFVGYRTEAELPKALEVETALRKMGVNTELYTSDKVGVKAELNVCNKKGIPFAAIVMTEGEIVVKDMKSLDAKAAHAAKGANQLSFTDVDSVTQYLTGVLSKQKTQEVVERKFAEEEQK